MNYRLLQFLLSLALTLALVSCEKDNKDDIPATQDWLDLLELQGDFSLFAEAAVKSGLSQDLGGTAYTLFVPGDSVFQAYLNNVGTPDIDSWINLYGQDLVKLILNYHIIHGPGIRADQFVTSFIGSNAFNKYGNPISLHILTGNKIKVNSYAYLKATPFMGGKLVIHEIDQVLYLPTVIDLVAHDPEFSLLRQSLQLCSGGLNVLLRQDNEAFCVFAPTNKGFQDYIAASPYFNDFKGFTQYYSGEEIRDIMLYHMLPQVLRSDSFSDGSYPTRLIGQSITLTKDIHGSISILDAYGNKADVMRTDIHALNGILHSVDYVLRPQ